MTIVTAANEFALARETAAKRHNRILRGHIGHVVSYGTGLYVVCGCEHFKGTFSGYEDHCRSMVIDAPVAKS